MAKLRLGALEAGGTKMVCAIGDENGEIQSWPGGTAILLGRCRRHFIAPWDSIPM